MCSSCEVLNINGVACHETGCPEAFKDESRECKWCGQEFTPEDRWQETCSHSCHAAYSGAYCDCEECSIEMEEI